MYVTGSASVLGENNSMLWSCYVHALYFRKTRVNYVIYIECVVASAVLCIEAERSASVVSFYKSPC